MKKLKYIVPNTLTLANLLCGCMGIVYAFSEHMLRASLCVGIALLADFLDGFTARLLNARSELGKQLDSLADMVTFGVLPGIMLFQMISIGFGEYFTEIPERDHLFAASLGFLIPLFAALRLGKFNIDEKQGDHFLGLPTPAVALLIASFPLMLESGYDLNYYAPFDAAVFQTLKRVFYWDPWDEWLIAWLLNPRFYIWLALLLSALMVLPLHMFSLKFRNLKWADNKLRYTFLLLLAILGIVVALPNIFYIRWLPYLDYSAIPLAVIIYILLSFANGIYIKNR